jgi:acyltransferase
MFEHVTEPPLTQEGATTPRSLAHQAAPDRLVGIDLVRVVGVVAIVAFHAFGGSATGYSLSSWHVPLFFFLSGYLWRSKRSLRDEVSRRARTLLVPYIIWLVIISATWAVFLSAKDKQPSEPVRDLLLGGTYIGGPYGPFWFVTCLFAATVIMRATWNVHQGLPLVVGVIGLAWIAVSPRSLTTWPLAIGLAIPAVFIMCVGLWFRRIHPRIRRPHLVGLIVLGLSMSLALLQVGGQVSMKAGSLGRPVLGVGLACATSAGLLLTCTWLAEHFSDRSTARVVALAECGLMVIFTHSLVISTARVSGLSSSLAIFTLALVVPFAAALAIRRTPLRSYLL